MLDLMIFYMYLFLNICDNVVKDFLIYWDDRFKFWLWDMFDFGYKCFMKVLVYMGFILQNVFSFGFVKVKLFMIQVFLWFFDIEMDIWINGNDVKFWYFFCKLVEVREGYYKLGCVFFQFVFFGVNYDDNLFYMVQMIGFDVFDFKERLISFCFEFQEYVGKYDRDVEWIQYWVSYWNCDDDD